MLREAEKLVHAGTKELLIISQDTSAYGVDVRHEERVWKGEAIRTHMTDLARALGGCARRRANSPGCGSIMSIPTPMSTRSSR